MNTGIASFLIFLLLILIAAAVVTGWYFGIKKPADDKIAEELAAKSEAGTEETPSPPKAESEANPSTPPATTTSTSPATTTATTTPATISPITTSFSGDEGTDQNMTCSNGKLVSGDITWGGKKFTLPQSCVGATSCIVGNPNVTYGDPMFGIHKTFSGTFVCDNLAGATPRVVRPDSCNADACNAVMTDWVGKNWQFENKNLGECKNCPARSNPGFTGKV